MKNNTQAYEKYVDLVFLVQNHLNFYVPRKQTNNRFETDLEDFGGEENIRYGMNIYLAQKIDGMLHFDDTKSQFKQRITELASNWDIDAAEMDKRKQQLEDVLFSHAKLKYCFDNYIEDFSIKNIDVLACLMTLYAKIVKTKKEKLIFQQIPEVSRTKFYRYVKEAYLEETGKEIKDFSKMSKLDLCKKVFDLCVKEQYLFTYPEEAQCFLETDEKFVEFKKDIEQEVIDYTIEDMRALDYKI